MTGSLKPDADLRRLFQEMRASDAAAAPAFSLAPRPVRRPLRRRALQLAGAAAVVAAVLLLARTETPPYPIDTTATRWSAPTDFLLRTPGLEILTNVPPVGQRGASTPATPEDTRDANDSGPRI